MKCRENNTYTVQNYIFVKDESGGLAVQYRHTFKDYYYATVYTLIALPLLAFAGFVFYNTVLTYRGIGMAVLGCILAMLFVTGPVFLLNVSVAYWLKPSRNVFYVNPKNQTITIRINRFKSVSYRTDEIKRFILKTDFSIVKSYANGRTIIRPLLLYKLTVKTKYSKEVIHTFEMPYLMLWNSNKDVLFKKNCSRISQELAKACGSTLVADK